MEGDGVFAEDVECLAEGGSIFTEDMAVAEITVCNEVPPVSFPSDVEVRRESIGDGDRVLNVCVTGSPGAAFSRVFMFEMTASTCFGSIIFGDVGGVVFGAVVSVVFGAVGGVVFGIVVNAVFGIVVSVVFGTVGGIGFGAVDGVVFGAVLCVVFGAVVIVVFGAGTYIAFIGDCRHVEFILAAGDDIL